MAGTFPLRVADLCFTDDAVIIPEYAYLTPLFGIVRGRGQTAADTARERLANDGLQDLREYANTTETVPYRDLRMVRVHDGGAVGRPRVAIHPEQGPPLAYRVHAPVDVPALTEALTALGQDHGFTVSSRSGLGFSPVDSIRRFVAGR